MKKFTDHIYYMENNPVTDQPYVYLIRGSKFNLQIDAGNSPENYHKFLSEVKELGLKKPKLLAITHWHWDHTCFCKDQYILKESKGLEMDRRGDATTFKDGRRYSVLL